MGAPHNKKRYGEKWDELDSAVTCMEIEFITEFNKLHPKAVTLSGGWAWCMMSPEHTEYKHAHDLKDIDLFVRPECFGEFVIHLKDLEYNREHTKYDGLSPFYRYTTSRDYLWCDGVGLQDVPPRQIILDVFVQDVPSVMTPSGYRVVDPPTLASFYGMHNPDSLLHGSGQCWSLALAKEIMKDGGNPIDNPRMSQFESFLKDK